MTQTMMKAVGLHCYLPIDDPESLLDLELPKPAPQGKDLLVKVLAVSVNPVDTKIRSPKPKQEEQPRVLGWDACGVVEAVGPDCELFQPGDEVYYAGAIQRQGSNSEYQLVDERIVGRKPRSLTVAEAAALPLTAITAWEAFFDRLGLTPEAGANEGRTVLIIGAAGGVGSIAVQLARWAGLTVIGTASRPESVAWVQQLGAHAAISHREELAPQLQALGYTHVDYIFCLNNTAGHWTSMVDVIAPQGRICSIVDASEPLNLSLLKNKSVMFVWEFMFTRAMYETSDMIEQHRLLNRVAELVDSGTLRTTMTERLTPIHADNMRLAHRKLESGRMIGKLVLESFE
ncbi:zinc-binding alcohol dehydrogenase family protein [Paenibacillus sp. YYML68]|uniref:zinc-binding alcohol dehydrogenase family protein n=1 Tax=Paenibacillus sp. YYML68 TaxID=2909250 RepID=UPI002492524D|nr:zinc-binding alcohol dehydrogenase family protein [Paenibacillus sp. YYML68]